MTGIHSPGSSIARRTLLKAGAGGLTLAALAELAACGNSGGGSSSKTLKMLYFGEQASATELQNRLQPQITKLDASIKFEISAINGTDWNDFLAKVLTQIAAGTPPDIISVATEGLQLMASKELAVPLDDYVTKDLDALKDYFADIHPALVESMMYQGHLWELPDSFNAGNMFYSTSLFQRAGVAPPSEDWTLEDFESAATKIAKFKGINAFGWVVRLWGSWTSFMYANNANLLEEGKYDGGDWLWSKAYAGNPAAAGRQGGWKWGAPTANSEGTVEALDYMIELTKKGLSPSPDVGGGGTLQGLFASNRIGMSIGGGFWAGGLTNAGMKNGSFDVTMFPKWKSQRHLFGAGGYAIFKSSKKKDLAWEVLKLLVKPESFDLVFPGNVTTPGRKSLVTAQRYAKTGPKHWSVFYDTLTKHPETAPIPAPPYYNALATALNQRTTQAISSGNAKAALDGLQSDLEKAAGAS
jgi:multiple sugar transport system substrate-binding protein